MKIIIKGELPDLNKYINAERSNRFIAAKLKKDATELVKLQSLAHAGKLGEFPVDVMFEWHIVPKRGKFLDNDNRSFSKKFILDGLVKAKVIPDDTRKYVGDFNDVFIEDTEEHVIVELT